MTKTTIQPFEQIESVKGFINPVKQMYKIEIIKGQSVKT